MIVLVVGMHRSGTSMLAGLLQNYGIHMGSDKTFYPKPSKENPVGFYENIEFRVLNDLMIESCGYQVKDWNKAIPTINASLINKFRMLRLILKYQRQFQTWGFKDPRICLTLHSWLWLFSCLRLQKEVKIIYVFRDPTTTAVSMSNRGNTDIETAINLWDTYNRRAISALDKANKNAFFIQYKDLLDMSENLVDRFQKFLKIDFSDDVVEQSILPKLNRSSKVAQEISHKTTLPDATQELYRELQHRSVS